MLKVAHILHPKSSTTILFLLFVFISLSSVHAQTNLPNVRITLEVRETLLAAVLDSISHQSHISFSYNPKKIQVAQKITYACFNKPLTDVLDELSRQTSMNYALVENQIILRPEKRADTPALDVTVSGYVKDQKSGEALIGASIVMEEVHAGASANGFGFFSMTIPKGKYTLTCSFIGYEKFSQTIDLQASLQQDIRLTEQPPVLKELVVTETPENAIEDNQTGKVKLTSVAVEQRPSFFGESDVVKSLESIPGVKLHSDGSTFYYVRGGNRDQNLVMVDDAPIYNPSHFLGLFSTIIPDVVNNITLYKGSMPASLGGRLSSVLDVRTKKGNDQHLQTWGNVGLLSTKLGIEGPFRKDKSSFLISARISRLKWIFHAIDNDISKFNFYDITAKANFKLDASNRIFFSFYNGADNYFSQNNGIAWTNTAGTFRWNHTVHSRLFMNTTIAASRYKYSLYIDKSRDTRWVSNISNVNLKTDFSYFIRPRNEFTFGTGITGYNFNPGNIQVGSNLVISPVSARTASEFILYANHDVQLGKWGFNYGARLSSWTDIGESFEFVFDANHNPIDTLSFAKGHSYKTYWNLQPRATISYSLDERSSFKLGLARNAQNIHLITNSISPFTSMEVWLPSSINIRPETSNQASFGYYHSLEKSGILIEAETFYKKMEHQIDYVAHAETLLNPLLERELRFGSATAYGLELLAKKDEGRLRGMAGYTYSRAQSQFSEINDGKTFNAYYDRPHQFNLMLAYDASLRWNLGMNWTYSTGAPYTSPAGFYKFNDLEVPLFGQRNNNRLPDYHRMDVSASLRLNKNQQKKFSHTLTFSIFNLYGRKNILFVNYNKMQNVNGDFRIPSNLLDASRTTSQYYLFQFTPSISYNFRWL